MRTSDFTLSFTCVNGAVQRRVLNVAGSAVEHVDLEPSDPEPRRHVCPVGEHVTLLNASPAHPKPGFPRPNRPSAYYGETMEYRDSFHLRRRPVTRSRQRLLAASTALLFLLGCSGNKTAPFSDDASNSGSPSPISSEAPSVSASSVATEAEDAGEDGGDSSDEMQSVQVFFSRMEQQLDCSVVEPVERQVPDTAADTTAALNELFKGTTEAEREEGLSSFFGPRTEDLLRSVHVEDGTAYVDLHRSVLHINNASTTCGSTAFTATMEQTVKQFPTVQNVRYAVEGDPGVFYEFIQLGCPDGEGAGRCNPEPFQR